MYTTWDSMRHNEYILIGKQKPTNLELVKIHYWLQNVLNDYSPLS